MPSGLILITDAPAAAGVFSYIQSLGIRYDKLAVSGRAAVFCFAHAIPATAVFYNAQRDRYDFYCAEEPDIGYDTFLYYAGNPLHRQKQLRRVRAAPRSPQALTSLYTVMHAYIRRAGCMRTAAFITASAHSRLPRTDAVFLPPPSETGGANRMEKIVDWLCMRETEVLSRILFPAAAGS